MSLVIHINGSKITGKIIVILQRRKKMAPHEKIKADEISFQTAQSNKKHLLLVAEHLIRLQNITIVIMLIIIIIIVVIFIINY